jgi:hypothetical protein
MGLAPPATALFCWEEELDTLYTDDMGRFPIRAQSGNQYIMLAYHAGANAILVQPFQTKADHHRIPAYQAIMARLKARNIRVSQQVLDNEASAAYKHAINIASPGCTIQFVPPDMHRRNKAERAIRTFTAHFLSILASVDPLFPPNQWDLLLPQAELTVNLLRQSTMFPTMSAWEHLNGPYNFDATPMGPPGCRIISHAKGSTRRSYDFRGNSGFYVGPSLEHYRCYKVVKSSTQHTVVCDTVVFQHPTLSCPELSPEDRIIHCLRALTKAIKSDRSPDSTQAQLLAIESLRAIFTPSRPAPTAIISTSTAIPSPPIAAPRPRVAVAPPRVPAALPRVGVNPPRVPAYAPHPSAPSTIQPIAHRTRSSTSNTNAHLVYPLFIERKVTFALPLNHADKYSGDYRNTAPSRNTVYNLPPSQVKLRLTKASQVKSGQEKPSQAKPSQVKSSQVESRQATPSQVKYLRGLRS